MGLWIKCDKCGLVIDGEESAHDCRAPRSRTSSAESVRRHRQKTGNAYGKKYAKARANAVAELIAMHPQDFAELLEKARADIGLGPTTRL